MQCKCCKKEITSKNSYSYQGELYCAKHYQQMLKHGHCLDTIQRTTKDLNDFEFIDDKTVKIITYNQNCEQSGYFYISKSDFENVIKHKWRVWRNRVYTGNFKPIVISRFLFQVELEENPNLIVDHINHNPFDNRRENLRLITQQENTINKVLQKNNTSNIAGVSYDKSRDKWAAEIKNKGQRYRLGRFINFADAVYVRYYAEVILFKNIRNTLNDDYIKSIIENCVDKEKLKKLVIKKLSVNSTH